MGKKKGRTPTKSNKIVSRQEEQQCVTISGLGESLLTLKIGPEVSDLENDRILLPAETFDVCQVRPGDLLAVALADLQQDLPENIPGLSSTSQAPRRQAQPISLWHNLEELQLVPRTDGITETEGLQNVFSALTIQDRQDNINTKEISQISRRNSALQAQGQRTGEPEAFQIDSDRFMRGNSESDSETCQKIITARSEAPLRLGHFVLMAKAWPGKISKGMIGLPQSIMASLGGSSVLGRNILVYKAEKAETLLGNLQLQLLESTNSSLDTEISAKSMGKPSFTSMDWMKRVMNENETPAKNLLLLSAAWHLKGQHILPGNPVSLPVLGRQTFFKAVFEGTIENSWSHIVVSKDTIVSITSQDDVMQPEDSIFTKAQAFGKKAQEIASETCGGGLEGPAGFAAYQAALNGHIASSNSTKLHDLGGMEDPIRELEKWIILPLRKSEIFGAHNLPPPRGVLLHGPPGTGKTKLAIAMSKKANASLFVINGPDVLSGFLGHSEQGIKGIFAAAQAHKPAIIFINELDTLVPSRDEDSDRHSVSSQTPASSASSRVISTLSEEISRADGIAIIAASNFPDQVDSSLRGSGRLDAEIEVGVPTPKNREEILRVHLNGLRHQLNEDQIKQIAKKAHGFVGADLEALSNEAAHICLKRSVEAGFTFENKFQITVTEEDFNKARQVVGPSALRDISAEVPNVRWEDIGGMESVKMRLKEMVEWPQKYAKRLEKLGAEIPKGVLLYGPPGCSKTMLAKAVATEAGLNFFSVKGGELFSKYVGDSEKAVATLFKRARTNAPSVIFFDEIDGLVGTRDDSSTTGGVENRVVATLLVSMDGLEARGDVIVIGATNRPDILDPALLRPGRFDRQLYVPIPDLEARVQILKVRTRESPLASDISLPELASLIEGFSGADITNVVREAGMAALEENLDIHEISWRHFDEALKIVSKSAQFSEEERQTYESFQTNVPSS